MFKSCETERWPDLDAMGWDDTFVSTCVNGFWIFYEYTYYDTYNEGNAWYAYGTDYCIDMPWDVQRTVSSVNYAGRGEGIDWDSLNLYQHDWFKGFYQMVVDDYESRVKYQGSAVVTGCSAWTLKDTYDRNSCVCLYPGDTTNCYPGVYTNMNLNFHALTAYKGCSCSNIIYPDEPTSKSVNGAYGIKK